MAFVVEEDEAARPVDVGMLDVDGVLLLPQGGAGLVEQFRLGSLSYLHREGNPCILMK